MGGVHEEPEDEVSCVIGGRCASKQNDTDDTEPRNRPQESGFRYVWKQVCSKCIDKECHDVVEDIDQELVPWLRRIVLEISVAGTLANVIKPHCIEKGYSPND